MKILLDILKDILLDAFMDCHFGILRDVQLYEGQNWPLTGGGSCAPAGVSWVCLEPTTPEGDAHAPR
jgi:hypothetical protein